MFNRLNKTRFSFSFIITLLVLSLMLPLYLASGCNSTDSGDAGSNNNSGDVNQEFAAAVNDARVADYSEISRDLIPINKYNPDLIWDGDPGSSRVLVVTWTGGDYYDGYVGTDYYLPVNVWVTVVPEIKTYFEERGYTADTITTLRVEQLLGLPPNDGKTKFVEIWAKPIDLFRPAPDPEISDREAELDFPESQFRIYSTDVYLKEGDTSYIYVDWFNYMIPASYDSANPMPWTRLGYTYNWGNSDGKIGLSEFVIKSDSTVGIKSVTLTGNYFRN